MTLLADRNFAAQNLVADIAATGAEVLVRLKKGRTMPILARYRDGSPCTDSPSPSHSPAPRPTSARPYWTCRPLNHS